MAIASQRILVAVTGASGSIYADRLVECLLKLEVERIYVVFSDTGRQVLQHELAGQKSRLGQLAKGGASDQAIRLLQNGDFFAPVASGSSAPTSMVVVPCSMGCAARIAHGTSQSLIERAADVMLKSRRPSIVCPRETPLSLIHLRNLTMLCEAGANILPLMPGFYHRPKSLTEVIDFLVGRILEQLGQRHDLYPPWNAHMM